MNGQSPTENAASTRTFVSVLDLVNSVARHVPTDKFEKNIREIEDGRGQGYWDRLGSALNRQIQMDLTYDFLRRAHRTSEAAAGLEDYLHHETDSGPRWFDWGLTGRPRLSDSARNEAMAALIHLSQYDKRCIEAWCSGKLDVRQYSDGLPGGEGKLRRYDEESRLRGIGFEQTELIEFLDRNGIPYAIDGLEGESLIVNPLLFDSGGVASADLPSSDGSTGLSTPDIAAAFAKLGGWSDRHWAKNLTQVDWAAKACVRKGRRGKEGAAVWHPVRLAQLATPVRKIKLHEWGQRFRENKLLAPWLEEWLKYEQEERWYGA